MAFDGSLGILSSGMTKLLRVKMPETSLWEGLTNEDAMFDCGEHSPTFGSLHYGWKFPSGIWRILEMSTDLHTTKLSSPGIKWHLWRQDSVSTLFCGWP